MLQSSPDSAPAWLQGQGRPPRLAWSYQPKSELSCLAYSREAAEFFVADSTANLSRLNRDGELLAIRQLPANAVMASWSDDGSRGALVIGENQLLRLDRNLQTERQLELPDVCLSVAVSPYGNHLAVSMANGITNVYNERNRKVSQLETIRPLRFLKFCIGDAVLFGAAESGLLCCFNLAGAVLWQQSNWTNVGRMCATGEGDLIYLASFVHGIQTLDGDGNELGAYALEGTVNRVDTTYESSRLIAATVEGTLIWLNSSGEVIWQTTLNDKVIDVVCDPLGEWALCGLAKQGIHRLDWMSA